MKAPAAKRAAAFGLDLIFAAAPLLIAAPLIAPLLLSERAADNYAGLAVGLMLCALGWLCFTAQQLWGLLRHGSSWGRRKLGIALVCDLGRPALAGRALVGPLVWAACALAGVLPLLLLWPAFYLLVGRGPADALFRCRQLIAVGERSER